MEWEKDVDIDEYQDSLHHVFLLYENCVSFLNYNYENLLCELTHFFE